MKKSETKGLVVPKVSLEDLFEAEGAKSSKSTASQRKIELRLQILEEATQLVQPTVIWREVNVVGKEENQLCLEGGYKLICSLLSRVAATAEKLLLFAMTLGTLFEGRLMEYKQTGKIMEAFVLDAAGTAFISKSAKGVIKEFKGIYEGLGLKTTFPMGPGHSYWEHLNDLQVIFRFLQPEKIGLSLNNSNLIIPRKSVAYVMGIGKELPNYYGKTHCDFCSLKNGCYIRMCC